MMWTIRSVVAGTAAATLIVLNAVLPVLAQQSPEDSLHWDKAAPFPEPASELYGTTVNDKMYVIGGHYYDSPPPGLVYEYDPASNKWTKEKNMPVPVDHGAQAEYGGKIYVFGGSLKTSLKELTDKSWEYDPATDSWKALAPMPGPRAAAKAEQVNGKIYVIGGLSPVGNGKLGNHVVGTNQVYDPAMNTWEKLRPMPTARHHAFSGIVAGKIYIIGGRLGTGVGIEKCSDVVEEYDPTQDRWVSPKTRMPTLQNSGGCCSATYHGKIYVIGGEEETEQFAKIYRAVERYDPATNEWEELPSMPFALHGLAVAFLGNKLHLVSGSVYLSAWAGGNTRVLTDEHDVMIIP